MESEWATFSWKKDEKGVVRWSFSSKLDPDLGLRDATPAHFTGRRSGGVWKTSLDALSVRVSEGGDVPDLPSLDHLGQSFKTVVMTEEVMELGPVHLDFALAEKGPFLLLRLRCPAVQHGDRFRLEEFVLFEADAEVSGDRPLRPPKPWWQVYEPYLVMGAVVAVGLGVLLVDHPSEWRHLLRLAVLAAACLALLVIRPMLLNYLKNRDHRALFVNGWNAWSFTGTVLHGEPVPQPGMPNVFSCAFHHGAGQAEFIKGSKDLSTEMFGLLADRKRDTGILLGFLSQHEQFGAFSFDPEMRDVGAHCRCDGQLLMSGARITSDWCLVQLLPTLPEDPLADYMDMAAHFNHAILQGQPLDRPPTTAEDIPVGWCSWYHFYEKISETNLEANLIKMASLREELPLQLFQIDDGYQAAWGDWTSLDQKKFPTRTMKSMVDQIRSHGLRPGLWMAPLAADKHSTLAKEHPKWIIRRPGSETHPANSANCGKWFYGLDVTNPEVRDFVKNTLTVVSHGQWNFDYLKLDFLYAAALKGERLDPTVNTAQALQMAMRLIREGVGPSTFVLGCGAPLGATIGWVNANRVSADAGPSWLPSFPLPNCKWNLPCGRNMVRNTINRLSMHGRWWINDPDCMLLRESTSFTPDEIIGIATVKAMSGGSLILSDDLESVSRRRIQIAQCLLPVTGKAAVALDLLEQEMPEVLRLSLDSPAIGPWVMVALCNWTDRVKDTTATLASLARPLLLHHQSSSSSSSLSLHVLDFWNSEYQSVDMDLQARPNQVLRAARVGIHSSKLYAIRIHDPAAPQYLGCDVHFSCGTEVKAFEWEGRAGGRVRATWTIDAGKRIDGSYHIWVSLPGCRSLDAPEGGIIVAQREDGSVCKVPLLRRGEAARRVFEVVVEYSWVME